MKKNKLLIILISMFIFNSNVFAATSAKANDANYSTLKTSYEKGIVQKTVSSENEMITIYGRSSCDSTGCTYNYANNASYTSFEEVLKRTVKCSNGEQYIKYSTSYGDGGKDYKNSNPTNYEGEVYWSEDHFVSCTTSSTGSAGEEIVQLPSTGGTSTGGTSTGGTSTGGTSSGYGSSTTTDPSATGVETYYIIIGIVGLITYGLMMTIKKYNLFKNI